MNPDEIATRLVSAINNFVRSNGMNANDKAKLIKSLDSEGNVEEFICWFEED